jgi:glutathione S-transferase
MACHIALEEIGDPYEIELVSSSGEREGKMTATATWRAVNPKGRIPALLGVPGRIGGRDGILTEVTAIMVYLARTNPQAKLLPATAAAEARCLEWMNWLASNVHAISYGQIWRPQRYVRQVQDESLVQAKGQDNVREQYAYINSLLADGRQWAIPEGYSIVDPYLLVFFKWGQRIGLEMRDHYPAWASLVDQLLGRTAIKTVLAKEGVEIA